MAETHDSLIGQTFGLLTIVEFHHAGPRGAPYYLSRCACGNQLICLESEFAARHRMSCGCATERHGLCYTRLYKVWVSMIGRCHSPTNAAFKWYGGRGITVCDRWRRSFAAFFADMGSRPNSRDELERIDNNGPYCKENCRWVTRKEQMRNTRQNHYIQIGSETKLICEWTELAGFAKNLIDTRLRRGWPVNRLLEKPRWSRSTKPRAGSPA